MKNPLKKFDNFFINLINGKMSNRYFDFLFFHITNLGGVLSLLSIVTLLLVFKNSRRLGIEVALSLLLTTIIVQILKRIFSRNRPYWILENLNTYGIDLSDYSFPSGHSAASFSIALIVALNYRYLAFIVILLAFIIALSRIYLAVHYPTDVLAGVIIGIICAFIVHYKGFPIIITYIENRFNQGVI